MKSALDASFAAIHLSHAAFADEGRDFVVAESGTDFESHELS